MDWRVPGAAVLAVLIWGGNFPVMKGAVASVDYFLVGALRTVLVGLPVGLVIALSRPALPRSRTGWASLLASAAGNYVAFPVLASLGLTLTTAARAGFIFASAPALTACLGALVMGDRISARRGIGIAVSFSGVAVLIALQLSGRCEFSAALGALLILLATIGSAVSYVAGMHLGRRCIGAWPTVASSLALASAPLSGAILVGWRSDLEAITLDAWAGLIYLSLFGTLAVNALWIWALSQGSIVSLASFQFLQPVFTVAIAGMFLSERLSGPAVAGGAIVLIGVGLVQGRNTVIGRDDSRRRGIHVTGLCAPVLTRFY
jgi:drug/metabolite transporter (DMT)-like permease